MSMNEAPPAAHIEISGGVQVGPARILSHAGVHLDCSDWGHMVFYVDMVDVEGGRLTLDQGRSYAAAIEEAEEAAADWGVPVRDTVLATPRRASSPYPRKDMR